MDMIERVAKAIQEAIIADVTSKQGGKLYGFEIDEDDRVTFYGADLEVMARAALLAIEPAS